MKQIIVGIADAKVAAGEKVLVTYALGSCVGVCIYDDVKKIGGLLHAMLSTASDKEADIARYVNTGVPYLYRKLRQSGADPRRLKAKIVGGAKMFEFSLAESNLDIGTSNIIQAKKCLSAFNIPITAQMTGGDVGRTIWFVPQTGEVHIRTTANERFVI